jgi:hypothetical protein
MMASVAAGSSSTDQRRKQFCPHQGADAGHCLGDAGGVEVAVMAQQAGDHRRQGKEVQDVVAEVGEQWRLLPGHANQIAERIAEALDHRQPLGVADDLLRIERAADRGGRVGRQTAERLVVFDHPLQGVLVGGVLRRGQQRERDQIDRVEHGRLVDPLGKFGCRVARGAARPVRQRFGGFVAPPRLLRIEKAGQRQRFAEVDMHLAEHPLDAAHAHSESPQRFALLGLAGQFIEIRASLHHLLVADVHRQEDQRPHVLADEAAHRHAEDAGLGRQHPAAAAAPAFDEVLEREAARQHQVQVFVENRRVERLALEAAAQEEGAATAQQRTDQRQVEVGAGSDVRRRQPWRWMMYESSR